MKRIISVFLVAVLISVSFATNSTTTFVSGTAKRGIPLALGVAQSTQLTGTTSSTLNITTQGFGDLSGFVTLGHTGAAVSTINVIVGGQIGDIITLQTKTATEDVVISENATIFLGAATRTLSDPEDKIKLMKRTATIWDEVGFFDNN